MAKFVVNGIEVDAQPLGNGMWVGVPVDLAGTIQKVLSGQINLADFLNPSSLSVTQVEEVEEIEDEEPVYVAPVRKSGKTQKTLRQWRKDEGLTKTEMADYIGVSRRSLGRYEDAGRLANEFGL